MTDGWLSECHRERTYADSAWKRVEEEEGLSLLDEADGVVGEYLELVERKEKQ